ncbi:uncharacterized protein HMPREF1541_09780 [Cyphellophora europaea CBS 101466]|uniref:Uncharacterized protein n=1 Tax=Cyphellophora europaea (strain CBS 101466) TaxID=1220924 RepID=W2S8G0_CYPE1|nr:uncharacterized protein HMPREF1541_09780 [Cyphellophora europaea CBS 101466]ETN44905.1 hypothetical protein HMPREF1541_09780 [Cyphellophora europaea CBS 101466]
MSLVDWRTGGLSKPAAGVLGSLDSATGAPETFRGEAIEKEAESFATALAGIAVSVWTAQDEDTKPSNQLSDPQPKDSLPRLQEPTTLMSIAMDKAYGVNDPSHDKTREPMQTALWSGVLPFLRFLYIVSDTWERLANALDPTPPFPSLDHKLRLAALLVLLALGTTFVSLDSVARILSFALGVGLFARPPLTWAISSLEQRCPGWSNLMSPEHHIFRGIPTNAQLAITLLRSAENHVSPLPLRPHTKQSPTIKPIPIPSKADAETWEAPLGASQADLADAAAPDQNVLDAASGPCSEIQATERRKPHRLFGLVKGGIKSTVEMTLKADKLRAKAGHQSAKNRIGILPHKNNAGDREPGPWIFAVRHDGKEGRLHIGADGTISFNDAWTIHATEITELKKHDGLGFKARVVVGWAMDLDVKDGLEITDRSGKSYVLTAVPQRDQLFNRLCAIGGQKWDVG